MTRPALATIDDLERLLPIADEEQAQALLERASAIVRAYANTTWLNDAGDLDVVPDDIPGVVAGMVERASRNTDGVTSETAGPFARSFGPDAAQRLYLTKSDKSVIRAAIGVMGIGTLATTRGILETLGPFDVWDSPVLVPTDSGEPIAWLDPSETPPPTPEPSPW